jgi:hypothetical protein
MTYSANAMAVGLALSKIFVGHQSFIEAIDAIGHALHLGNGAEIFAGVRVIAPAGTGKSLLLECVQKNVRKWPILNGELPIIHTSLKEAPSVAQIQDGLLKNFNYGLSGAYRKTNNNEVNNILVTSIKQFKVQAIALDEFQHVFLANGASVSLPVIDWLKRLMNLTAVPAILLGTEQLERLAATDPQLTTRIPTTVRLHAFKYDETWLGFLKAFAQKAATVIEINCIHEEFGRELFICTRGVPRTFKAIVIQAAMIAIDDGKSRLERAHLKLAYRRHVGNEFDAENPF